MLQTGPTPIDGNESPKGDRGDDDTNGFDGRYIVVADEDRDVVGLVIETLLKDGHAVFQAYDGLSALQLALGLKICDLVISNTESGVWRVWS